MKSAQRVCFKGNDTSALLMWVCAYACLHVFVWWGTSDRGGRGTPKLGRWWTVLQGRRCEEAPLHLAHIRQRSMYVLNHQRSINIVNHCKSHPMPVWIGPTVGQVRHTLPQSPPKQACAAALPHLCITSCIGLYAHDARHPDLRVWLRSGHI